MQGGTVQGIGWALNEEYFYDAKGMLRNSGLLDYRMPTCLDLPMIETCIVEVPAPGHPIGSRGVGEVSIVPPPAAVANAIANAVGVRMTELPMSPGRVLKAILHKEGAAQSHRPRPTKSVSARAGLHRGARPFSICARPRFHVYRMQMLCVPL